MLVALIVYATEAHYSFRHGLDQVRRYKEPPAKLVLGADTSWRPQQG
jgi:hypothetical protein